MRGNLNVDAKLEYCGDYIAIRDFHHYVDDEKSGNPYNCIFDIAVKSGAFSGIADKCECDYKELQKFIAALEDLISFKRTDVTFCEIGYGNRIQFQCDKTGHIEVFGEIQGNAGSHILKFEFMTDQTVFPKFINELKDM